MKGDRKRRGLGTGSAHPELRRELHRYHFQEKTEDNVVLTARYERRRNGLNLGRRRYRFGWLRGRRRNDCRNRLGSALAILGPFRFGGGFRPRNRGGVGRRNWRNGSPR